jgi:hypothetical protein
MSTQVSLYSLGDQYLALLEKLTDAEFDEATIADTIESTGIVDEFKDKAVGVVMVSRQLAAYDDAVDTEIARLRQLKERRHKAAERLLAYLKNEMVRTGITRIESPRMVIALRDNPASVEIYDERMLPRAFLTNPPPPAPAPDKKLIASTIKAGGDVPGARLVKTQRVAIT